MSTALTVPLSVPRRTTPATNTYGVITLDGIQYIERPQVFTYRLEVNIPYRKFTGLNLTLPGQSSFLLKALTRDSVAPGPLPLQPVPVGSQDRRFQFRLNNQQGTANFVTGGLGILNDPVTDTMCFGNGQFPYLLIPPIPLAANATLVFDVIDLGFGDLGAGVLNPDYYPYIIYFAFQGSYLIPAQSSTFL